MPFFKTLLLILASALLGYLAVHGLLNLGNVARPEPGTETAGIHRVPHQDRAFVQLQVVEPEIHGIRNISFHTRVIFPPLTWGNTGLYHLLKYELLAPRDSSNPEQAPEPQPEAKPGDPMPSIARPKRSEHVLATQEVKLHVVPKREESTEETVFFEQEVLPNESPYRVRVSLFTVAQPDSIISTRTVRAMVLP